MSFAAVFASCLIALAVLLAFVPPSRAAESDEQRWQRISQMAPEEKSSLLRQQQEFSELSQSEQDRLRQLDRELDNDPNGDELRQVMAVYTEWLDSLPGHERAALAELPPEKRLARIKELRKGDADRAKTADMEGVYRWMKEFSADPNHQAEIIKTIPEQERRFFSDRRSSERDWYAMSLMLESAFRVRDPMWRGWPDPPDWLGEDDLAGLRGELSPLTRRRLEKMAPEHQWEHIRSWFEEPMPWGFLSGGMGGMGGFSPSPPEELQEELSQFFEELSDDEQNWLLNQPGDELQRRLREMYFSHSAWQGGGGSTRRGGGRDGRSGRGGPMFYEGDPPGRGGP